MIRRRLRRNPSGEDARMRALERQARAGDPSALEAWLAARRRAGLPIPLKEIELNRVEGPTRLLRGPVVFSSWLDAQLQLNEYGETAPDPETHTYDKVKFVVTFMDGETYDGRFDLQRGGLDDGGENLYQHVRNYLLFLAGERRPAWTREPGREHEWESMQKVLARYESEGTAAEARRMLDVYGLRSPRPQSNPPSSEVPPKMPDSTKDMRIVCAWCKKVLQEGPPGAPISHGMCAACRQSMKKNPDLPERRPEDQRFLPALRAEPLPKYEWKPPRATFELAASGRFPLVYVPEGSHETAGISGALSRLLTHQGLADPGAWYNLLAAAGMRANVFLIDRRGERWRLIDVLLDYGGETGRLVLRHLGAGSRSGDVFMDIRAAYGHAIPVVVYKPAEIGSR